MSWTREKRNLISWWPLFVFLSALLALLPVSSQGAEKPRATPEEGDQDSLQLYFG